MENQKTGSAAASVQLENFHIYLLIGQSNMAGRAPISSEDSAIIEDVELLVDSAQWEPAQSPLNKYSSIRKDISMQSLGPGHGFAKKISEQNPEFTFGLVVNALGGSSINSWKKGDNNYEEAVKRTKWAMQDGVLKGILWHQGESDSDDPDYLTKAATLISNFRSDFDNDTLPFVAGQIAQWDTPWAESFALFNALIPGLPDLVPHTAVVSTDGLSGNGGDDVHFNAESQHILGERYADAIHDMVYKKPAGCMQPLATNYDPFAQDSCDDCCLFETSNHNPPRLKKWDLTIGGGQLCLALEDDGTYEIHLYAPNGKKILSREFTTESRHYVNIENLKGLFILELKSGSQTVLKNKLILF
jgi:hypothetical protein